MNIRQRPSNLDLIATQDGQLPLQAPGNHAPRDTVAGIAQVYTADQSRQAPYMPERLLGFLLELNYEKVTIVTCDPWKRNCGGIPRNSFVFVKLSPDKIQAEEKAFCDRIIMIRVTESVPTPVASEIQQTIFQIHKSQANVDAFTNKEFQWSGLKGTIIGTFHDKDGRISFSPDVDTFFAPHCYEVYAPDPHDLERLLNAFNDSPNPLQIGNLRYTETPSLGNTTPISIKIDPSDFTGKTYGHRTALFGKTRFGKSNTMKVIAETVITDSATAGQIIFDPSGEYTYWNEQDEGCLALFHPNRCRRYSLKPRPTANETRAGLAVPEQLGVDFYANADVGFMLIWDLWDSKGRGAIPTYISTIKNWNPIPVARIPNKQQDASGHDHAWRSLGLWWAILYSAGFRPKDRTRAYVKFKAPVSEALLANENLATKLDKTPAPDKPGGFALSSTQPVHVLPDIFAAVATLWEQNKNNRNMFGTSSGEPYFNATEEGMLAILTADRSQRSGATTFSHFTEYHTPGGSDVFERIASEALAGHTVLADLSMGSESLRKTFARQISQSVLNKMMTLFSNNDLSNRFIVLYFEEAHTLFPRDDRALDSDIYNKLAKEGAKFHISMVYATQSISSLSPDLLKNTENMIVTHLDDDREVKELEHKRAFRDVANDVERITSKGFVRMKTLSLPFALPVQIRKFEPPKKST